MKQRVQEMEEEAAKLRELQAQAEAEAGSTGANGETAETEDERAASDNRSIFVGNVSVRPVSGAVTCTSFNVRLTCGYSRSRLTMPQHPKKFKLISRHAGRLTV
jgi:hypothetical protein